VTHNIFRLLIRAMPLIVAALMIAAQTLAAFHSVAHANKNTLVAKVDCVDVQEAANTVLTSSSVSDTRAEFWNALFGHAADGTDNAAACVVWDAAYAAAALLDAASQPPASVVYSIATLPPVTRSPELADLLRLALARAPPRG
jgi:predicted ribosomally synthesized peptide with SipW-like signal peptide